MPNSIGISPLHTSHPLVLHSEWVRASTWFYPRFTLLICSSSGFGSSPRDLGAYTKNPFSHAKIAQKISILSVCSNRPIQARFHCVSGIRHPLDSRVELTRWIVLQKARGHPSCDRLPLFVSMEFQFYFTSLIGILFTFPSRY